MPTNKIGSGGVQGFLLDCFGNTAGVAIVKVVPVCLSVCDYFWQPPSYTPSFRVCLRAKRQQHIYVQNHAEGEHTGGEQAAESVL